MPTTAPKKQGISQDLWTQLSQERERERERERGCAWVYMWERWEGGEESLVRVRGRQGKGFSFISLQQLVIIIIWRPRRWRNRLLFRHKTDDFWAGLLLSESRFKIMMMQRSKKWIINLNGFNRHKIVVFLARQTPPVALPPPLVYLGLAWASCRQTSWSCS